MNEILQSLSNLGLTDKESRVYLAILKLGEATVGDISDEAMIKRPTTYLVLDELRKKGMVLKIPYAKKTIFQAKSPDDFYKQAIENIDQFERVLPKMRAMNPRQKSVKTLYFEGLQGLKEALFYRINDLHGEIISGFWAKDSGVEPKTLELLNQWGKQNQKNKNVLTGITPDHESIRKLKEIYPEEYGQITLVPTEEYSSDISIDVTKDFVRIIDPHNLKGIIIENDKVADAIKQIFEIVKKKYEN
jgi:predicted transcriptional regulator